MTDYPNWFAQSAQYNFEVLLDEYKGVDGLKFLQLGAYTGDASLWLAENILTGNYSYLLDVDTWEGSDELDHKSMDFDDVYKTYCNKVYNIECIGCYRISTKEFLCSKWNEKEVYNFIYIDADHTTVGVLLDAELSWPLLKSGGIMSFDDYTWGHESGDPRLAPMVGIDLFLHRHQGEYELLAKNTQVWLRKK